jgi:ABC-type thiamin/hydroxymethylpyrimidine transport system permease subunit
MWIIPLWSYYPINRYWIAAAGLSTAAYPFAYLYAGHHHGWWSLVVLLFGLRSLALILGTLATIKSRALEAHSRTLSGRSG